jgi:hypothetical protein
MIVQVIETQRITYNVEITDAEYNVLIHGDPRSSNQMCQEIIFNALDTFQVPDPETTSYSIYDEDGVRLFFDDNI